MREKEPLPYVVEKYIQFLSDVKEFGQTDQFTLTQLIGAYKINKTVRKALVELSIINLQSNKFWHWLSFDADRKLALTILNFINERSKKQRVTPIAGLEEFVTAIKAQTEIMGKVSRELQSVATELKNSQINDIGLQPELFTIDSQRLQVYCAALGGMLTGKLVGDLNSQSVLMITDTCKYIADNSISLLLNKA